MNNLGYSKFLNFRYIEEISMDEVITKIHPNDGMFVKIEPYHKIGQNALQMVKKVLFLADRKSEDIKTILDMASGYGRVTRYLSAYFKDSKISVCDTNKESIEFCRDTFNTIALHSNDDFKINSQEKFDLIWCGSLLTHLDKEGAKKVFQLFDNILNKNGILIFTTHGREIIKTIENMEDGLRGYSEEQLRAVLLGYYDEGFGFIKIGSRNYGLTVTSPSYIMKMIEDKPNWQIIMYNERKWNNLQDVVAIIKNK